MKITFRTRAADDARTFRNPHGSYVVTAKKSAPAQPPPSRSASNNDIIASSPIEEWISFEGRYLVPVVDRVTNHLLVTCQALDDADAGKAARELHAAAAELRRCAAAAAKTDSAPMRAEAKLAQSASWRLAWSALKVNAAAAAIDSGAIKTRVQLQAAIDGSTCADIERRWLVVDEAVWYPVCREPQRHFAAASLAWAQREYETATTELAKAISFVRLEAARAIGNTRLVLECALKELTELATQGNVASINGQRILRRRFATTSLAMAVAHRRWASESWVREDNKKAGYEFKATADSLESVAGWVEDDIKSAASRAMEEANAIGRILLSEEHPNRDQLNRQIELLGHAIGTLGLMTAQRQSRSG